MWPLPQNYDRSIIICFEGHERAQSSQRTDLNRFSKLIQGVYTL